MKVIKPAIDKRGGEGGHKTIIAFCFEVKNDVESEIGNECFH